jgi:hypothetical protein
MICFEALFAALIAYKLQGVAYLYRVSVFNFAPT